MRLEIGLVGHLGRKGIFDDEVRGPEAGVDIAFAPAQVSKYVAELFDRNREPLVRQQVWMQHRRVGFGRLYRIEYWLQLFILYFDQIDRLLRRLFSVRRHR